ncbi:HNRNP arginine N-methyltransferase [Saitoella complicata NRRL Y-17804]|uniref:type I protein arginine methyltransferase n=1 Tax=Saitoella complicata (strain BCRC 22490 / CBS 7301 / JCM 7358 / NBRC 10748 / NRRL Y-17804) TaxID=698492 RepID=A0A0E9NFJ5_SAICN|nr:HNRNP arginine N-methyltransferase [Saitoella complicata NRRL Y-17804]ODQ51968.1 HNRNP arginine N-methyltransferase [Saitoella complicata NRRL Y-17804]GAO48637.1 hypothetical protein G7K_2807-t1 [Saitoella complicata NRRL Y-17804]
MSSELPIDRDPVSDNDVEDSDWDDFSDAELTEAQCLFCHKSLPSIADVFAHCTLEHSFDFYAYRKSNNLDIYGCIRLINYIRSKVQIGEKPDLESKEYLEGETYLRPVLENDPLIFDLDDEDDEVVPSNVESSDPNATVERLAKELADLRTQFTEYKNAVRESFESKQDSSNDKLPEFKRDDDTHYFESYGHNEIHETMLKDTARTEGYRDFIYDNKHLFVGKVVLDVGCGTGILSMFCAKAGAAKVFAVDNSSIVHKARANVMENGLDKIVTVLQGKIEDLELPVKEVDIIVSEWMGYGLIYESMYDSVLNARDRYLIKDGLMIPSETRLLVAGLSDEEYINDKYHFWNEVYGFKMTAMKEGILDEAHVESIQAKYLNTNAGVFKPLPAHDITVDDLSFTSNFEIKTEKAGPLTSFLIWFDTYFTARGAEIEADALAESWKPKEGNAFTTGPKGKDTHWHQTLLMLDEAIELKEGDIVKGSIRYGKAADNSRELDIEVNWSCEAAGKTNVHKLYKLR